MLGGLSQETFPMNEVLAYNCHSSRDYWEPLESMKNPQIFPLVCNLNNKYIYVIGACLYTMNTLNLAERLDGSFIYNPWEQLKIVNRIPCNYFNIAHPISKNEIILFSISMDSTAIFYSDEHKIDSVRREVTGDRNKLKDIGEVFEIEEYQDKILFGNVSIQI